MTSQADQTAATSGAAAPGVGTTDADPDETAEWLESFDAAVAAGGPERGRWLLEKMAERADGSGPAGTASRFNGRAHPAAADVDHSDIDHQWRLRPPRLHHRLRQHPACRR